MYTFKNGKIVTLGEAKALTAKASPEKQRVIDKKLAPTAEVNAADEKAAADAKAAAEKADNKK